MTVYMTHLQLNEILTGRTVLKLGDTFINPPANDVTLEWVDGEDFDEQVLVASSNKLDLEWEIQTTPDKYVPVDTIPHDPNVYLIGGLILEMTKQILKETGL